VMGKSFSLNADRDPHIAVCPGSWPRRLIRSEETGRVGQPRTFTCASQGSDNSGHAPPATSGAAGGDGESMDNHWERHETDEFLEIGAYQEIEYRLRSLRALVCDLLKTNQELRTALLDAGIDMPGREEMRKHA
jgi:hypothetical protein